MRYAAGMLLIAVGLLAAGCNRPNERGCHGFSECSAGG